MGLQLTTVLQFTTLVDADCDLWTSTLVLSRLQGSALVTGACWLLARICGTV